MTQTSLISVRNLVKRYGGVVALDGMNLEVRRGTVHAVVGENGAGKSTLMKALAGAVRPDGGEILLDGQAVSLDSPNAARRHGVGIVYQELSLFPERSVLANLFVNREPTSGGFISLRRMEEASRDMLDRLGLHVDLHAPLSRLSIGEQQLVELCRVLLEAPRLVILDEPNSALNAQETERLFGVLERLRRRGITMLYVSHRLEEVFAIADAITVTRNGRDVMCAERAAVTIPQVIEAMVGVQPDELFPPPLPLAPGLPKGGLTVEKLGGGDLREVTFAARLGEVIGVAGLEGSGVATMLQLLFGSRRAKQGSAIYPDGKGLPRNPTEAARRGVCLVPADRRRNGLMLDKSILFNISHVAVGTAPGGLGWFSQGRAKARALRQIEKLRIRARDADTLAGQLSGGNQQKVVIGKWLEMSPRVFLLDDPTRGVDVGAKREIYRLIREMASGGGIVIFSSTELPELIGLCDRVMVLYGGRLAGELSGRIDSRDLLHLINTGGRHMPAEAA